MRTRLSLSIFLIVAACATSLAQPGKAADSTPATKEASLIASLLDFKGWLDKLNGAFNEIVAADKRDQCIRRLGYLGSDLDAVISQKQKIILLTKTNKSATKEKSDLNSMVSALQNSITNLTTLLNDVYGEEGNKLATRLRHGLLADKAELTNQITTAEKSAEVIAAAEEGIKLMIEASALVWQLRAKLQGS